MEDKLKHSKRKILCEKVKKQIKKEIDMGKKVELEHGTVDKDTNITNDNKVDTMKIAMAHLREIPDYYTRLDKMEKEGKKAKRQ